MKRRKGLWKRKIKNDFYLVYVDNVCIGFIEKENDWWVSHYWHGSGMFYNSSLKGQVEHFRETYKKFISGEVKNP